MTKSGQHQRENILLKAGELFWIKGYAGTSMKDIGRACGFESPNIYTYYRSKEQLLYEVIEVETSKAYFPIKHLENDTSARPVDRLREVIVSDIRCVLGKTTSSRLLYDVELKHLSPAHRKKIIQWRDRHDIILNNVIRRGIDNGDFAEIDEKMATYAITSIILRSRVWFSAKGRLSVDEIANFIFSFVLSGLTGNSYSAENCGLKVNEYSRKQITGKAHSLPDKSK